MNSCIFLLGACVLASTIESVPASQLVFDSKAELRTGSARCLFGYIKFEITKQELLRLFVSHELPPQAQLSSVSIGSHSQSTSPSCRALPVPRGHYQVQNTSGWEIIFNQTDCNTTRDDSSRRPTFSNRAYVVFNIPLNSVLFVQQTVAISFSCQSSGKEENVWDVALADQIYNAHPPFSLGVPLWVHSLGVRKPLGQFCSDMHIMQVTFESHKYADDLIISVNRCWVTPTNDPDYMQYHLITHGGVADIVTEVTNRRTQIMVEFTMVEFSTGSPTSHNYMHCHIDVLSKDQGIGPNIIYVQLRTELPKVEEVLTDLAGSFGIPIGFSSVNVYQSFAHFAKPVPVGRTTIWAKRHPEYIFEIENVQRCWISPSTDPEELISAPIIDNGFSITRYATLNEISSETTIEFLPVFFEGESLSEKNYLHCTLLLSWKGNLTSECPSSKAQSSMSRRRINEKSSYVTNTGAVNFRQEFSLTERPKLCYDNGHVTEC